jgi:hypothetical protein
VNCGEAVEISIKNGKGEMAVLVCQACGKAIVAQQCSQVTQHLSGNKNTAAIARLKQKHRPGK